MCRQSLLLAILVFVVGSSGGAKAEVDIPIPSWMETTPIADKMVINGLPSRVYRFEADRNVEDLLEFYRQRWARPYAKKPGYREVRATPWRVISRLDGRFLFTVQAKKKTSLTTEGYLAKADLQEIEEKDQRGKNVPKMAGSRIVNDSTSYDPGKKGRTLMIHNHYSASTNGGFYRDHYLDRGWGQLQDQQSAGAQVLAFRKLGKEVRLVIRDTDNGAVVVMNMVESR